MLGLGNRFAGTVTPIEAPEGIVARRFDGYISIDLVVRALNALHPVLEADATVRALVVDGLGITGFEPGMPMRAVQWLGTAPSQLRVALCVTMSPVLIATTRASRLLLPHLHVDAVATVPEALRLAEEHAQLRRRVTTGVQRRVAVPTPGNGISRKHTG